MDKEMALKLHRELWTWLAENPTKEKIDWPKWEDNSGDIRVGNNFCICCEMSYSCGTCLLEWPHRTCDFEDESGEMGLFSEWVLQSGFGNLKRKSEIAMQIANLPENKFFRRFKV